MGVAPDSHSSALTSIGSPPFSLSCKVVAPWSNPVRPCIGGVVAKSMESHTVAAGCLLLRILISQKRQEPDPTRFWYRCYSWRWYKSIPTTSRFSGSARLYVKRIDVRCKTYVYDVSIAGVLRTQRMDSLYSTRFHCGCTVQYTFSRFLGKRTVSKRCPNLFASRASKQGGHTDRDRILPEFRFFFGVLQCGDSQVPGPFCHEYNFDHCFSGGPIFHMQGLLAVWIAVAQHRDGKKRPKRKTRAMTMGLEEWCAIRAGYMGCEFALCRPVLYLLGTAVACSS